MTIAIPTPRFRVGRPNAVAKLLDIDSVFINPIPHQARALERDPARVSADALLTEAAGVLPLLLRPRTRRVAGPGVAGLSCPSSSATPAPFGLALAPSSTRGQARNRGLNPLTQVLARP